MLEVDVRGYACPIPVVKTRKAMEESPGEVLIVLCDSSVSKENVCRIAKSRGYCVTEEKEEGAFRLLLEP